MVPALLPLTKRSDGGSGLPASAAVMWIATLGFYFVAMVVVGAIRVVAPWTRTDCRDYSKGLLSSLDTSLKTAVEFRAAGTTKLSTSRPPARSSAGRRPGGTTGSGSRPGTRRPHA